MSRVESGKGWENVLRDVPLFEGVSARHVRRIAELGRIVRYAPGTAVVRAADAGDACYVVFDGTAEVVLGPGLPVVPLTVGSVFGEMALIDDAPRSANVVAATELTCFRLDRGPFLKLLRSEPTVTIAIMKTLARRLRAAQAV